MLTFDIDVEKYSKMHLKSKQQKQMINGQKKKLNCFCNHVERMQLNPKEATTNVMIEMEKRH